MNLTDLLAHPSTNCPECGGSGDIHQQFPDCGNCGEGDKCQSVNDRCIVPTKCPNDFHTITPERTERELMGNVEELWRYYFWTEDPEDEGLKALSLIAAIIFLAKFVNARGIVQKYDDWSNEPWEGTIEVINWITMKTVEDNDFRVNMAEWAYGAFDGIQSLATAAGIDLMAAIGEQVNDENTSAK